MGGVLCADPVASDRAAHGRRGIRSLETHVHPHLLGLLLFQPSVTAGEQAQELRIGICPLGLTSTNDLTD